MSCRAGESAELAYPRPGFVEYGRLPRGLKETRGDEQEFDGVLYYMLIDRLQRKMRLGWYSSQRRRR
jgi:hypothetical protein